MLRTVRILISIVIPITSCILQDATWIQLSQTLYRLSGGPCTRDTASSSENSLTALSDVAHYAMPAESSFGVALRSCVPFTTHLVVCTRIISTYGGAFRVPECCP